MGESREREREKGGAHLHQETPSHGAQSTDLSKLYQVVALDPFHHPNQQLSDKLFQQHTVDYVIGIASLGTFLVFYLCSEQSLEALLRLLAQCDEGPMLGLVDANDGSG